MSGQLVNDQEMKEMLSEGQGQWRVRNMPGPCVRTGGAAFSREVERGSEGMSDEQVVGAVSSG